MCIIWQRLISHNVFGKNKFRFDEKLRFWIYFHFSLRRTYSPPPLILSDRCGSFTSLCPSLPAFCPSVLILSLNFLGLLSLPYLVLVALDYLSQCGGDPWLPGALVSLLNCAWIALSCFGNLGLSGSDPLALCQMAACTILFLECRQTLVSQGAYAPRVNHYRGIRKAQFACVTCAGNMAAWCCCIKIMPVHLYSDFW